MADLTFAPDAEADLVSVQAYISRDDPQAAARWTEALIEKCLNLASAPGIGAPREDLGKGVRLFPAGSYLIFYRAMEQGIEVIRVLHAARNVDAIFEGFP